MSNIKYGDTKKIRLLPEQVLFKQGEPGDKAFLINQGTLDVLVDNAKVGYMSQGELFGEMALILDQQRSATIVARDACELIEITKEKFQELLDSASIETKKLIVELCEELSKRSDFQVNFSKDELEEKIKDENPTVSAIARQIFFRLNKSTKHIE